MASSLLLLNDRALTLFYPLNNERVKDMLYERVEHAYGENYGILCSVIARYLAILADDDDEGTRIARLVEFIGAFDKYMVVDADTYTIGEYLDYLGRLYDTIDDTPDIITRPMHEQFYARLYDILVHETEILPHALARFRGFISPDK